MQNLRAKNDCVLPCQKRQRSTKFGYVIFIFNKIITLGKTENQKPFTTQNIAFIEGTIFYIFTDGLADQFGGPNGKKFKYKPFSDLLLTSSKLSLNEQKNAIDFTFERWRGELEQVDDVCVIGITI